MQTRLHFSGPKNTTPCGSPVGGVLWNRYRRGAGPLWNSYREGATREAQGHTCRSTSMLAASEPLEPSAVPPFVRRRGAGATPAR